MATATSSTIPTWRRLPIGVETRSNGESHARVWAPRRTSVELVTYGSDGNPDAVAPLESEAGGFFSGSVGRLGPGTRYRFRLDGGDTFPDPASRYQPEGPHGPSEIVDPATFRWTDTGWRGMALRGQIISEIHIGTFTPAGTFRAAIDKLDLLVDVGITAIEVMPIADFAGRFGWGYDGVNLYAPARIYGTPDDFRALVDAAHARGLGVILDVVYNHLGPDGNYLAEYSDRYVSDKATEWGDALNFDGEHSEMVRSFFVDNAGYWISEFHVDGLRLDATHQIFDHSDIHLIADVVARAHKAAGDRSVLVIAENERQDSQLLMHPTDGGFGVDAVWNDDFHHSAYVALTGTAEAYLSGYRGTPQEFISAAKYGFLYQGQFFAWQSTRRGTPTLRFDAMHFVNFLESHDQVANRARSQRLHQLTTPGRFRAMTALLLLMPQTPMIFQGEEFCSTSPFPYFADHQGELAQQVRAGRQRFADMFPSVAAAGGSGPVPDPASAATFEASKLDWSERDANHQTVTFHRELIALRKSDPVISGQRGITVGGIDGAVIAERAFILRFFSEDGADRLLIVNLENRLHADPIAEPLLAPPPGARWRMLWSSEDPRYGGSGTGDSDVEGEGWWVHAQCAVLLVPTAKNDTPGSR